MRKKLRINQRGSSVMEFAIIAPFLMLLFFGSIGSGIMLGRYIQAVQVCRDVAHMYTNGVNFTNQISQDIVTQKLASGVGMTSTGGNGVVILSRIITVFLADCTAAGISSGNCGNAGQAVITQRIAFGDPTLRNSSFGTPTSALMNADGNIQPNVYLRNTDPNVRATGFAAILTAAGASQQQGDSAWVVETFFKYPDIGFLGTSTAGGAYARFIY